VLTFLMAAVAGLAGALALGELIREWVDSVS
jgi:hypothetical protein